ncbi:FATE1 [Cervus elaphus hippelaphus]|uniref:FATE1 n=1 Tax=Cervus elaphus hippelaphus TaxID=46360 RepID=A0A212C0E0_CEREH|nr:fetal and adult testis-expressed transcript protein isoform X1 [Cervus canadensis]XP_043752911.1 fetal and adult testis-expressed transcript protein isoform X1 [Cervus elaphus]OWJ99489.1 FATE1 [Cervus elaphus hippelaphus]
MAGGAVPNLKEKMQVPKDEDLLLGSFRDNQECSVAAEMKEHISQLLGASQRRQKVDPKAAGSAVLWNMAANQSKKVGTQLRGVGVAGEQGHGGARPQENPGGSQGMRSQYERRQLNTLAEIGLEELNELEMEIMRRQLFMITERLRDLEDQSATWRQREVLLFTMLLSSCITNLWLWMRQ